MGERLDIEVQPFPEADWSAGNPIDSLRAVRDYVLSEANQAIDWYSKKRVWKRFGARLFRMSAIGWTALAGLIPLFWKWLGPDRVPGLDPVASTVCIAFAGINIALDRFLGCSSGWVRYMQTGQELQTLVKAFRFDFSLAEMEWRDREPDADAIQSMFDQCRRLLARVDEIVQRETNLWVAEFEGVLAQIDQSAKTTTVPKQAAENGGEPAGEPKPQPPAAE